MERLLLYTFLVLTSLAAHAQVSKRSHPLSLKREQHTSSKQAISPSISETQGKIAQFGFSTSANYVWDSAQWSLTDSSQYVYVGGRLRSETLSFSGFPFQRTFYSYDAAGRQAGTTTQFWNGTAWTGSFRDTIVYNTNGDEILRANLTFDPMTQQWDSSSRTITVRTYNASQKPLSEIYYNKSFGQFGDESSYRYSYYYLAGDLTACILRIRRFTY